MYARTATRFKITRNIRSLRLRRYRFIQLSMDVSRWFFERSKKLPNREKEEKPPVTKVCFDCLVVLLICDCTKRNAQFFFMFFLNNKKIHQIIIKVTKLPVYCRLVLLISGCLLQWLFINQFREFAVVFVHKVVFFLPSEREFVWISRAYCFANKWCTLLWSRYHIPPAYMSHQFETQLYET